MRSVVPAAHPLRRSLSTGACVHSVNVDVSGPPQGEAGHFLPIAALGLGLVVQDTCFSSQTNFTAVYSSPLTYA